MEEKVFNGRVAIKMFKAVCLLWILIALISHFFSIKISMVQALGIIFLTGIFPYALLKIISRDKE